MRYEVRGADGSTVEVEAVDWMMAMAHAIAELGIEVSGWACQTRPDGSVVVVDPMTGRYWEVQVAGPSTREDNPIIEGRTVAPSQGTDDDLVAESADHARFAPDATPSPAPLRRPRAATLADFGNDDSLDFGEPLAGDEVGDGDSVLDTLDAPEPPPRGDTPPPALDTRPPAPDTRPPAPDTPEPTLQMPEPSRPAPAPTMPPSIGTPTPSRPPSQEPPPERPRPSQRPRRRLRAETEPRPERVSSRRPPAPPSEPPIVGAESGQAPGDLAEQLFDLSAELSSATDAHDACRRALDLCLRLIKCEAGSVLRGGINDSALTFVAVAGPAADQLLNRKLPFGHGIVGASFDLGITIGVDDVGEDPRHASDFDQETGFRTRSVLCVPVQGREHYHGAIQLLNPISGRFVAWHRDAVEQLAASLASFLDG